MYLALFLFLINKRKNLEKQKGKRPFWRARYGWQDNTEMDLRELGCDCVEFSCL
jgi:hypothetical protein